MLIDKEKLERILIANWAEFLDVQELIKFSQQSLEHLLPNCSIFQLKISRFELSKIGFILWLSVIVIQYNKKINTTIEAFLTNNGNIKYVNSMMD